MRIVSPNLSDMPPDIGESQDRRGLYAGWTRNNLRFVHRTSGHDAVFFCKWCKNYAVLNQGYVKSGATKSCGCRKRNEAAWKGLPPNGQGAVGVHIA